MSTPGKLARMLLGAFALWFLLLGTCFAAGTIRGWAVSYEQGERHKALFHLLDCADSYKAPSDDILLFPIVSDALKRGGKVAKLAMQVFVYYNHLYGAREEKTYPDVLNRIRQRGVQADLAQYKNWLVIIAKNGANLRDQPDRKGKVLTALKFGMQVRVLGKSDHWLKVKPVGPSSIDPRFERFMGFLHDSTVARY